MSKYFPVKYGRSSVRPFKKEDVINMMIMLQKKRDNELTPSQKFIYDRDWLMIKLGLNTAFRISDLLKLSVNDNLKKGIMYIREDKTNKEQYWELNQKLHRDVLEYIHRNNLYDDEFLFKSRIGINNPISTTNAWMRIKKYSDELGIKYLVGCHSLRKCFARTFYEETKDLITLQKMLNHASPQITLIYICWDDEDQLNARKNFYL
jgi:integrase